MKKMVFMMLSVLLIAVVPLKAQTSKASMKADILKFSSYSDEVNIEFQIVAQNYSLPSRMFEHFTPMVSLVDANDEKRVLFSQEIMFFSVSSSNLNKGQFKADKSINIYKDIFFKGTDKYKLHIKLKGISGETWRMSSKVFTIAEINTALGKKLVASTMTASNKTVNVGSRGIDIAFNFKANIESSPQICLQLYQNGKPCADIVSETASLNSNKIKLSVPYTSLTLPKGNHKLTYRIWVKRDEQVLKELYKGELDIVQPQLYWLNFESKNADINVMGLDKDVTISQMFSKTGGRGYGDAYFVLWNKGESLFGSKVANNSGNIPNQKGKVQTYLNEKLTIKFLDSDVFSFDFIDSHGITLNANGRQTVHIKKKGRIENFEFYYSLTPVTNQNYK